MCSNILGIDIGSVSISAVEMNANREIVNTVYEFHNGKLTEKLTKLLNNFNLSVIYGIAATSSTPSILKINKCYDNRVSIVTATRHFYNKIGSILFLTSS